KASSPFSHSGRTVHRDGGGCSARRSHCVCRAGHEAAFALGLEAVQVGLETSTDRLGVPEHGAVAELREAEFQEAIGWRSPSIERDGGFRDAVAEIRRRSEFKDPA